MSRAAAISRKISLVPRGRRSGADWEAHVEAWRAAVEAAAEADSAPRVSGTNPEGRLVDPKWSDP